MRLKGKVAIVIGASEESSMGAATARLFAKEGAKVIIAARRLDKLESVAAECKADVFPCDITQEEQIQKLAKHALDVHGKIDIAVNFVGVSRLSPIVDVTYEDLLDLCKIHFIGSALFIKHMAKNMAGGGSIITTSSLTAFVHSVDHTAYAGTKAGVDEIVRIAANELGKVGIRVNSIAPGFTRSAMTEAYFEIKGLEAAFLRETPLGRLGTVEDVANAALWLASDESRSTTGQIIDITAGGSLRRTPVWDEIG